MSVDEIENITRRIEVIDGDAVYILDKSMKDGLNILEKRANKEKDDSVYSMLKKDMRFICTHDNFAIAFRPTHSPTVRWIPCLIYKYKGEWRRVVIQYVNCLACDWTGTIANPTDPDLYITLENEFEILRKMGQLCFCKCPRCGSKISSRGIWIEGEEID